MTSLRKFTKRLFIFLNILVGFPVPSYLLQCFSYTPTDGGSFHYWHFFFPLFLALLITLYHFLVICSPARATRYLSRWPVHTDRMAEYPCVSSVSAWPVIIFHIRIPEVYAL